MKRKKKENKINILQDESGLLLRGSMCRTKNRQAQTMLAISPLEHDLLTAKYWTDQNCGGVQPRKRCKKHFLDID